MKNSIKYRCNNQVIKLFLSYYII